MARLKILITGDSMSALHSLGVKRSEWEKCLAEIAQNRYPGMNVSPPLNVYESDRPHGWPSGRALLKSAGLALNADGWAAFVLATTGVLVLTVAQSDALRGRKKERGAYDRRPISRPDERQTGMRFWRDRVNAARRSPTARKTLYRRSYRRDYWGAIEVWRPLLEWDCVSRSYREIGEYSVWQII